MCASQAQCDDGKLEKKVVRSLYVGCPNSKAKKFISRLERGLGCVLIDNKNGQIFVKGLTDYENDKPKIAIFSN